VISQQRGRGTCDLAFSGRRDFGRHVVIARKGCGQVLDAVLDPLYGFAGDDRRARGADIAGIGADLVAKAAADVGEITWILCSGILAISATTDADHMRRLESARSSARP
jgi:hypothetical protein